MVSEQILLILRFAAAIAGGVLAMRTDLVHRKIPNKLTITLLALGLVFRTCTEQLPGLLSAVQGAALGFAVLFMVFAVGGGGAGDVKFMAAVGAWLGPYHTLIVYLMSAILLLLVTLGWTFWKYFSNPKHSQNAENSPWKYRFPYAVPATGAVCLRLVWLLFIHRNS